MVSSISGARASKMGMFSEYSKKFLLVQEDETAVDLDGQVGNDSSSSGETTPMRPQFRKNSLEDLLEQLLSKMDEAFIHSFKENLLEQIVLLLEKNTKLLEYTLKNNKLAALKLDHQSNKLENLMSRLEKIGVVLKPQVEQELKNHLRLRLV